MMRLSVTVQSGRLELDKKLLRATVRAAGNEVAAAARGMIRGGGAGKGKRHKVSAPGQAPNSRSGALARSIGVRVFKSGEGVTVRAGVFYGKFMETGAQGGVGSGRKGRRGKRNRRGAPAGTRVLLARPYLSTALASRQASIAQRMASAINSGMKFQKVKS